MFLRVYLLLIFITLQQNVRSTMLGCYICHNLLQYHYVMTAESVPYDMEQNCGFTMSQRSCAIKLEIDLDSQQTFVNVTGSSTYVETSIIATATIENNLKHKRYVTFWCSDHHGGCNNEHYLRRVLQSITIQGSFQELEHLLIPTNETLNSSSCLIFSNSTTECSPECHDELAHGCYINSVTNDIDQSLHVCEKCLISADYHLDYSMTFFIENINNISDSDNRHISCAIPYCNSVDNLERMNQLMTIDFNATAFFDSTTTTEEPYTTTTSIASIFQAQNLLIFYFFIFSIYLI